MRHALIIAVTTCLISAAGSTGVASAAPIGLSSMTKADIYTVAGSGPTNAGDTGDGGAATSATLNGPNGSVIDAEGNLLIADTNNNVVRLVAGESCAGTCPYGISSMTKGDIYTIAGRGPSHPGHSGDGGPATSAELNGPTDVGVDGEGNLLIADANSGRIRLVANESCSSACAYGLTSMTPGDIYTIAGDGSGSTTNGAAATSTGLDYPSQAIVDSAGDVLIATYSNNQVQIVAEHSCSGDCPYGLASMTTGDIYRVAGTGTGSGGYSGDGGSATSAKLNGPSGIALDSVGNLLIADMTNNVVRVVSAEACAGTCPYGLSAMTVGDIYTIVGNGTGNYAGDGGPALSAELDQPNGVVVDTYGNLIIMDGGNGVVRLVAESSCSSATTCPYGLTSMTAGDIYTVAGDGSPGYSGDGGAATLATMDNPASVAIDQYNDLLISDYSNNVIRLVSAETCSSSCTLPSSPGGGSGGGSGAGSGSGGTTGGGSGSGQSTGGGSASGGSSSSTSGATASARTRLSLTNDGVAQGSSTSVRCGAAVAIERCSVVLSADGRVIGRGAATVSGSKSVDVAVKLDGAGQKLLDGTVGYLRAAERITATTADGKRLTVRLEISLAPGQETVTTAPGSFVPNSAALTSTGRSFVAGLANQIRRTRTNARTIISTGYTANLGLGDTSFALALGLARARTVADLLRQQGIIARYVTVTGAASEPIASNSTSTGQAHNRRVQVHIVFAPTRRTTTSTVYAA